MICEIELGEETFGRTTYVRVEKCEAGDLLEEYDLTGRGLVDVRSARKRRVTVARVRRLWCRCQPWRSKPSRPLGADGSPTQPPGSFRKVVVVLACASCPVGRFLLSVIAFAVVGGVVGVVKAVRRGRGNSVGIPADRCGDGVRGGVRDPRSIQAAKAWGLVDKVGKS